MLARHRIEAHTSTPFVDPRCTPLVITAVPVAAKSGATRPVVGGCVLSWSSNVLAGEMGWESRVHVHGERSDTRVEHRVRVDDSTRSSRPRGQFTMAVRE
eukprot:6235424-Prymnesium_polylepis.1